MSNMDHKLDKPGWSLVFHEEFEGPVLNPSTFSPYGISHWKPKEEALADYEFKDSCIVLRLSDENQHISAITTGMRDGMHRYSDQLRIDHHDRAVMNLVTQYGYFELRAKVAKGSGLNSAWWMIGFENEKEQNAEVDIFELLGKDTHLLNTTLHALRDSKLEYAHIPYQTAVDLSEDFHTYGLEWDETGMKFYLDHELYWQINQSPNYPMATLLQINDGNGGWIGELDESVPYPKEFYIDYFRVYKREGMPMQCVASRSEAASANLASQAVSGLGNDISWGDLYKAESHICYINDGQPDTRLESMAREPLPHAYYLDWSTPQTLDSVALTVLQAAASGPTSWDIEVSEDGESNWRKVHEVRAAVWEIEAGQDGKGTVESVFEPQQHILSLRIIIHDYVGRNAGGSYFIQDLSVYNQAAAN